MQFTKRLREPIRRGEITCSMTADLPTARSKRPRDRRSPATRMERPVGNPRP
jgi:hypothetical protein